VPDYSKNNSKLIKINVHKMQSVLYIRLAVFTALVLNS